MSTVVCTLSVCLQAQHETQVILEENLIPNRSFETLDQIPTGWFFRGDIFSATMGAWSSPTEGSPDTYGPGIGVPPSWAEKGFGNQVPKDGNYMVGITMFGCLKGKPHCREYLQVPLMDSLVPGQKYQMNLWVSALPGSIPINSIGAHFSEFPISEMTDEHLPMTPHFKTENVIDPCDRCWVRISGTFHAGASYKYAIIGNFSDDLNTRFKMKEDETHPYAYYYVDLVSLHKVVPIIDRDTSMPSWHSRLIPGEVIQLKHIYFGYDESEFLPESFPELNKLLLTMRRNPKLQIEIRGHTDSMGPESYNLRLSRRRAQSVRRYLVEHGVDPDRLLSRGFGLQQPVATNQTAAGRQLNRRVEIFIVRA
jgi:OOP family OmpA-OmpF porin